MTKKLKEDEWIDTSDGIGKVISVNDFYVEEYSNEYKKGKSIGEYSRTILIYKIYLDFLGNPRKRNYFKSSNEKLCSRLSNNSEELVNRFKSKYVHEYENIEKKKFNFNLSNKVTYWINVPEEKIEDITNKVTEFKRIMPKKFNYLDIMRFIEDKDGGIDILSLNNSYTRARNNLGLILDNMNYEVKDHRALFSDVKVVVK